MQKLRYGFIVLSMLMCLETSATAQVSVGIGFPNVRIGINLPLYPELIRVPGYPVYYAPRLDANYFFYDGMYWVYQDDNWYASSWYNGPWGFVEPEVVPLYILRIPVRYYRQPPVYFRGWQANAPPRWGDHWGPDWEQQRRGWDRWKRGSAPAPAPLPVYQRQYTGDRYPRQMEQQRLQSQKYRYQPRDKAIRQHFQQQGGPETPAPFRRGNQEEPRMSTPAPHQPPPQQPPPQQPPPQQPPPQQPPPQQPPPQQPPPQQRGPAFQEQRPQPGGVQREQQSPGQPGQERILNERGRPQEPEDQRREQEQRREEGRGRERNN